MLDTAPFAFQTDAPPLRTPMRRPQEGRPPRPPKQDLEDGRSDRPAAAPARPASAPRTPGRGETTTRPDLVSDGRPRTPGRGDTGSVSVPGASFHRQSDADDYFQRLAMAGRTEDAPTGMIIMPEVYSPDLTGAISPDGRVMVTGSMKVSHELAHHGAYRDALDSPEIDEEPDGEEEVRGPHRPVRARDAVVARRATGVSITPTHERRIRVSIWIVAAAIGVAVAGVAAIMVGLMNGWF